MNIRINIEARDAVPAKAGAPAYEILRGQFFGELDPRDPLNAIITDLSAAPLNSRGHVDYSATFAIAKPVDMEQASGVLIYDAPNRGMGWMAVGPGGQIRLNCVDADPEGHVRVVSGWQADVAPAPGFQRIAVPIARAPGGESLTGPILIRFTGMTALTQTLPIGDGLVVSVSRPSPVSLDTRRASLFRQDSIDGPLIPIASDDWAFSNCANAPFPGDPDPTRVSLREGFHPAYLYCLVYEAKDPPILGIGFAATRDFNAFLRYDEADSTGTPNPLAGRIKWAIAAGVSQSGNFLRSFLHLGFNADARGHRVFDGLNIHVAARHVPLNVRFGLPGGAANLYELGSEGPLWWFRYDDRVRGRGVTSLLDRCATGRCCPKIMETFGSGEFWGLRVSPNLIGTDAKADIPLPDNVRRYYFPGVTHGGSFVGGFLPEGDRFAPGMPKCTLPGNPNPVRETLRALSKAFVDWIRSGKEPPASRYPTLAGGDLVEPSAAAMGWPAIPATPSPDGKLNPFLDYDVGEEFHYDDVSGVLTRLPPRIRQVMPSRVPRVDIDGNELAGVPSVQHLVPLGTYTGWNELAEGFGRGGGSGLYGGFIPFAPTKAERMAARDPRTSLEERYGNHQGFVERVRAVTSDQVAAGWLLPEDAETLFAQAEASSVLKG